MIQNNNSNRVVFILGSTGVGKTKVAEDVAVKILMDSFSEMHSSKKKKKKKTDDDDDDNDDSDDDQMVTIVNMDALQVHEELPIATARVLVKEEEKEEEKKTRGKVVHELFGVVGIEEEEDEETTKKKTKTKKKDVRWFRTSFLEIVEKIWKKRNGKRSVVVCVGGTPYYAKAAMLKTFLPEREASMPDTSDDDDDDDDVDILSLEERRAMHEKLRELDPKAAARLHPKDARRVRRYLQIAEEANGEESLLPSTIFQRKKNKVNDDEGNQLNEQQLMFPPTVTRVIHVVAENEALEETLETRLERMRHDGVEKEIKTFIEAYPTAAKSNTGVAQAIGVREFLDETDDDTETRFEKMCTRTKRLARRQRRQFANMVESSEFRSAPTIEIDATKMHEMLAASPPSSSKADAFWEDEVVSRAVRFITEEFVDDVNAPSTKKSTRRDVIVDLEENNDAWIERACEACGDRIFRGDRDWLAHTSSKRHKNRVRNLKKSREGERGSLHPNKIAAI
ncbi:unnamed protein product [Bathycoccus prasinos]